MKVEIKKGIANGIITAPPSKSMAHRLLICAGLSEGKSTIHNISYSQDILATLDCLSAIGVKYSINGDTVKVKGINPKKIKATQPLNCQESGSTMRFFVPICLLSSKKSILCGKEGLMSRPMDIYKNICKKRGLFFSQSATELQLKGTIESGVFNIPGNVSSQFISGLLFALPLIDGISEIILTTPIESYSYINMTIAALNTFGVNISWQNKNTILIKGNQKYISTAVDVEGDYSNTAFFEALNIFGGLVNISGLNSNSIQGDRIYKSYFEQLKQESPTLNISNCPDLGPILFAVAAVNNGGTFTGTKRLKIKESDRGQAMAQELKKFGVNVTIYDDKIIIDPIDFHAPIEPLYGHNDHRIVMACSVLLTLTGGIIEDAQAVAKSFPDYFEKLSSLGIEVNQIDDNN